MQSLGVLTSNYIINVEFIAWLSAQVIKTILTLIVSKRFVAERLVGAGGMPSSHSALVCALAMGMVRKMGFASPEFALALALAGIVMYDAMGVRRAAGEQAKVLNKLVFDFKWYDIESTIDDDGTSKNEALLLKKEDKIEDSDSAILDKELKEFIGHTPLEVLGGALLGILVAMIIPVK